MTVLVSTAYLPPISFFKEINPYKTICIDVTENYQKQSVRNRCFIYGANGVMCLTVPVQKQPFNLKTTKDIKIDYSTLWQKIHWRSIVSAYNSSPFFMYYNMYFGPLYEKKFTYLAEFNEALLITILNDILKLNVNIEKKISDNINENHTDMRYMSNFKDMNAIKEKFVYESYYQVFADKYGFFSNLSIIDLLFNEGKFALDYLKK